MLLILTTWVYLISLLFLALNCRCELQIEFSVSFLPRGSRPQRPSLRSLPPRVQTCGRIRLGHISLWPEPDHFPPICSFSRPADTHPSTSSAAVLLLLLTANSSALLVLQTEVSGPECVCVSVCLSVCLSVPSKGTFTHLCVIKFIMSRKLKILTYIRLATKNFFVLFKSHFLFSANFQPKWAAFFHCTFDIFQSFTHAHVHSSP